MKILHVINSFNVGGAESLLLADAIELRRRGIVVEIIVLEYGEDAMESRFSESPIKIHRLRNSRYRSLPEFLKLVREISPDVLHTHLFPAFLYGCIAKICRLTQKFVHTEHNTINNRRKKLLWFFDAALYIPLDGLTFISNGVREATLKWNPLLKLKYEEVIENASVFSSQRNDLWDFSNAVRFVTVGRLVDDKNIKLQIQLIANTKKTTLDIVGDGPLRAELEKLVSDLSVSARVNFLGIKKDLKELYKNYDVYLHSATLEGFGLVVVEAMSAGLPVIVPRIPGLSEVAGTAGIFYEVDNIQSLSDVVNLFLKSDSVILNKFRSKSLLQARRFSIEVRIDKLLKFYSKFS